MLSEKINLSAFQQLALEQEPVNTTIWAAPFDLLSFKRDTPISTYDKIPKRDAPISTYNPNEYDLSDDAVTNFGYKRQAPVSKYKPELAIPSVLGIATTDKTSRGVFEQEPLRFNPVSVYNQPIPTSKFPLDATSLVSDTTDSLLTFRPQTGSPLGIGYTGENAYAQATDMLFVANEESSNQPPPDSGGCAWYDVPCKVSTTFANVKGEVTILIVGIIILAIGIFALTR